MEAVPRLHMLWFALKASPEKTSFANLKKYIAECYHEDPESYSKDVHALETLRHIALSPTNDLQGCANLKRYYCQLHSLMNRFPQISHRSVFTFIWKDLYRSSASEISDLRYEMAAILFNIAALHTQAGALASRGDADGMKLACTHFQCAAWSFGELKEKFTNVNNGMDFMTSELLVFMRQVAFAQAQECILEKSLIDHRKSNIVAKVTAQIITYYSSALTALLIGGEDGPIGQVIDSHVYKLWKKYVKFKIAYLGCVLYLYQGQHAEEQQKMGERVALYQAAWEKLEEARKESKGLPDQKEVVESLTFTADVVEAKRKNAKNENEFIYHEAIPELSDIPAVQGANLVNGIGFSVTDPDVAGEDIFRRLVPMKAHEASSLYSEEKAKILRDIGNKVEEKDLVLASYMSSLTLDTLNISEEKANKVPQGIIDRCASLNANKSAIPELIASMSHLAEICTEVETNLNEIKAILNDEEEKEKQFQENSGVHRANGHLVELTREFHKYSEAHQKAGESNDTLRKAMELHVNNLKILSKPLQEIQSSMPKLSGDVQTGNMFKDLKLILNKVNEMKAQRAQFHADLRIAVNNDDITTKVIAHGIDEGLQSLFEKELKKHEKQKSLIETNLSAQENILAALTEAYAKAAPILKTLSDLKSRRDTFFSSLAASFDVYEDLLGKSAKGLEFYKKLSGNVQKLLDRVRAAKDVQEEERQQRIKSVGNPSAPTPGALAQPTAPPASSGPKLKDYLKGKRNTNEGSSSFIPPIRPNPLGSETPSTANCAVVGTAPAFSQAVGPNEPPPPYSVNQQYDQAALANASYYNTPAPPYELQSYNPQGYTNPINYEQITKQMDNLVIPSQDANFGYQFSTQRSPGSSYAIASAPENVANQTVQGVASANPHLNADLSLSHQNKLMVAPSTVPTDVFQQQAATPQNSVPYSPYMTLQGQEQPSAPLPVAQPIPTQYFTHTIAPVNHESQFYQSQESCSYPISQIQNPAPVYSQSPQNPAVQNYNMAVPQIGQANHYTSETSQHMPALSETIQSYSQIPHAQQNYQQFGVTPIPNSSQENGSGANLHNKPMPSIYSAGGEVQQQFPSNPIVSTQDVYSTIPPPPSPWNGQWQSNHPGYGYNTQSGFYEYGSGYQGASTVNMYGQYTNAIRQNRDMNSVTTDSGNTSKISSHNNEFPIVSHAKKQENQTAPTATTQASEQNLTYYNLPYGYQSNGNAVGSAPLEKAAVEQTRGHSITYMQSGQNYSTQTTSSDSYSKHTPDTETPQTPESSKSTPPATVNSTVVLTPAENTNHISQPEVNSAPHIQPQPEKPISNIDLLTDIDFSLGSDTKLPEPALKPQIAPANFKLETSTEPLLPPKSAQVTSQAPLSPASRVDSPIGRKMSSDNISICSDLSSLDQNLDVDSASVRSEGGAGAKFSIPFNLTADPFTDPKTLKYFHKEVERFEKTIESLNVQMLNGSTPLKTKWKDLHDMLEKDSPKRTAAIAKLFPEKNRANDCIPFDHARVVLETSTDDYINAAYVKDLGPACPNFIITQTPQQNTLNDFWSMIWSQKARTVLCLHTPNELFDPFWPQENNAEMHFDDFTVKLVKITNLPFCTEFNLKLSMNGADAMLDLSLIQIKAWTKSSPTQILGIANDALMGHTQRCLEFKTNSPLLINCLTGSERSEQIAIAICAILATQAKRPLLINVVDVWYRICSQRQNALKDLAGLELSMQIVLSRAHDVLNKRGIMTSYQMKTAQTVTAKEKEEVKDPLNELDPLWKLKQK